MKYYYLSALLLGLVCSPSGVQAVLGGQKPPAITMQHVPGIMQHYEQREQGLEQIANQFNANMDRIIHTNDEFDGQFVLYDKLAGFVINQHEKGESAGIDKIYNLINEFNRLTTINNAYRDLITLQSELVANAIQRFGHHPGFAPMEQNLQNMQRHLQHRNRFLDALNSDIKAISKEEKSIVSKNVKK
jgi:hypothetical protein